MIMNKCSLFWYSRVFLTRLQRPLKQHGNQPYFRRISPIRQTLTASSVFFMGLYMKNGVLLADFSQGPLQSVIVTAINDNVFNDLDSITP